jgi:hypothetical protein
VRVHWTQEEVVADLKSTGDVEAFAANAGRLYRGAADLNREDFQLRALKYPLLRLSVHGLSAEDQKDLATLAREVVAERDVTEAAERITGRQSASPIAVAIAGIVVAARGSKWLALLGSVVGAHAALSLSAGARDDVGFDVVGAIVGAACLESGEFVQRAIGNDVLAFVERDV